MKLLIKQRVFSWSDTYDIYDENETEKYFVKAELFAFGHRLHVYDTSGSELGVIRQKLITMLPAFEIEMDGRYCGRVQRKFTWLKPKYEIDLNGWNAEGDFMGWDYEVFSGDRSVAHIRKELFHWGDTYVIDIVNPEDELMALMLTIAIDAANCTDGN